MNFMIEIVSRYIVEANFAAFALDTALKSFVVLAVAAGLCLCWRRASAATRHWVWLVAVTSLLFLPLLSFPRPAWPGSLWAVSTDLDSANQFRLAIEFAPIRGNGTRVQPADPKATIAALIRTPKQSHLVGTAHFDSRWLVAVAAIWVAGVVLVLFVVALAQIRLRMIRRRARTPGSADWEILLQETRRKLDIGRPVILVHSADELMPMTWGWRRPVVLLSAEADQWAPERLRVVLLHELAHVKRWDCLTQTLSRIVCAFYWFNPLVWLAAQRMRVERERACDDLVLNGGCKASDYASHLVEIAERFRRVPQVAAIAMARSSGLQRRVTAILDGHRNRNTIAKITAALIALAVAGFALLIGACSTTKKDSPEAWSIERSEVGDQLKRFVAEKEAQAYASAKPEGREVLPEYKAMFAAAAKGDWLSISNLWEDMRKRAPQYDDPGPKDDRLHGTGWQTMLEIWGSFGHFAIVGEKYIVGLGKDAIASIPPGSIYFGGTDP